MSRTHQRCPTAMITRRGLVDMIFALAGPTLCVDAATASIPTGSVIAVTGSCTVRKVALKLGGAVVIGDTIEVPLGGKLKLQMIDGSTISIAPESSVTVANYSISPTGHEVKLFLAQGLLRAIVPPMPDPSTFAVSTAVGTASSAHPADWFTETQPGSSQVGVLAGRVDLTSAATGRSVSIPARWGTRLEARRDPVPPRVWAHVEFDAFIRRIEQ